MTSNEHDMVLVDPNSPDARNVAATIIESFDGVVPFSIVMGGIIRLFSTMLLRAVDVAEGPQREAVRENILLLLSELTEAITKWPDVPAHLSIPRHIDGKIN